MKKSFLPVLVIIILLLLPAITGCSKDGGQPPEDGQTESGGSATEPFEPDRGEDISQPDESAESEIPQVMLEKFEITPEEASGLLKESSPGTVAIESPKQLAALALLVNSGDESYKGKTYILQNDINLSGYDFVPIGGFSGDYAGYEFNASFNGGDNLIKNLTIRDMGFEEGTGLFGRIGPEGKVENLHITNGNIKGKYCTGGFAGRSSGILRNCSFQGEVYSEYDDVGGFAGSVSFDDAASDISACFVNAMVSGNHNAGTFAGEIQFGAKISDCYALGSVTAVKSADGGEASFIGGFAGSNSGAEIIHCYSNTEVYTKVSSALVGAFIGSSEGKQEGCYYNHTATSNWKPIGNGKPDPEDESGTVDGVTGRETLELCERENYAGWDFKAVWDISDIRNRGLPFLR